MEGIAEQRLLGSVIERKYQLAHRLRELKPSTLVAGRQELSARLHSHRRGKRASQGAKNLAELSCRFAGGLTRIFRKR